MSYISSCHAWTDKQQHDRMMHFLREETNLNARRKCRSVQSGARNNGWNMSAEEFCQRWDVSEVWSVLVSVKIDHPPHRCSAVLVNYSQRGAEEPSANLDRFSSLAMDEQTVLVEHPLLTPQTPMRTPSRKVSKASAIYSMLSCLPLGRAHCARTKCLVTLPQESDQTKLDSQQKGKQHNDCDIWSHLFGYFRRHKLFALKLDTFSWCDRESGPPHIIIYAYDCHISVTKGKVKSYLEK